MRTPFQAKALFLAVIAALACGAVVVGSLFLINLLITYFHISGVIIAGFGAFAVLVIGFYDGFAKKQTK